MSLVTVVPRERLNLRVGQKIAWTDPGGVPRTGEVRAFDDDQILPQWDCGMQKPILWSATGLRVLEPVAGAVKAPAGRRYQRENDWHGLYRGTTGRDDVLMTPASVAHPAKMSGLLLERIVAQMQEWGWLKTGDTLCDPFGGTGRTALFWCGLHPDNRAVTCEIEPHFVQMEQDNKAHAERKLGRELRWVIVQGDSRRFDELSGGVAAVTSPPYASGRQGGSGFTPPKAIREWEGDTISDTPGQIASLPDAAITSPPYEASLASGDPDEKGGLFRDPKRRNDRTLTNGYSAVTSPPFEAQSGGNTLAETGPLADPRLKLRHAASRIGEGAGYAAGVTSPPYENITPGIQEHAENKAGGLGAAFSEGRAQGDIGRDYGDTNGQIGTTQGETYADACLAVYQALARAGVRYVCVVTKDPTRQGKLRRIGKLTCRLLRQAGYRVVGWRRAWLFENAAQEAARTGQGGLFDDVAPSKRVKGRLSFFRRLHLAKGGVAAQWEDCFFAELREP